MNVLVISGKLRSGKSTLAKRIEDKSIAGGGKVYKRRNLADALKEDVADFCEVTVDFINDNKTMFRPVLQWYGTEFRRKHNGEDYWITRLLDSLVEAEIGGTEYIIVDDCRFPNEVEAMRKYAQESGGKFHAVRLVVSPETQIKRTEEAGEEVTEAAFTHASETALDTYTDYDQFLSGELPKEVVEVLVTEALTRRGWEI
jgi:hypothetical protein